MTNEALCPCCDRTVCARVGCKYTGHLTVVAIRVAGEKGDYIAHDVAFCWLHR